MLEKIECPTPRAQWAALPAEELEKLPRRSVAAFFRLAFVSDGQPLTVRVSAADRYRLYLNGASVSAGPAKGDRWNHYYDTLTLKPAAGANVLLARVMLFPALERSVCHKVVNGPTSLLSKTQEPLFFLESEEGAPELSTGFAPWQAAYDPATEVAPCPAAWQASTAETFLGDLAVSDWAGEGGAAWPAAQPLFASDVNRWGEMAPLLLKERPIPLLTMEPLSPESEIYLRPEDKPLVFAEGKAFISAGETRAAELSFDALYTAFVRQQILSGRGEVRLIYSESYYRPDGSKGLRDDRTGTLHGVTDTLKADGRALTWDSFWFRTMRFLRMEVTAETDMTVALPTFTETRYPLDVRTKVTGGPDWVKDLWTISLRTLERCTHETYEDCPYYEQLQYISDARLEMLFTYCVSGDTRMPRRTLWDFHCSQLPDGLLQSRYPSQYPQVIPVFSLYWVMMLEDYYEETGDAALIKQYRSTMDGVLDYFDRHIGPSGLTEHLGYWDFADWVHAWDSRSGVPFAVDDGPCSIHNLLYALALQTAARLAKVMDRPVLAEDYLSRAWSILRRVHALCWDEARRLYRSGPDSHEFTQHAQVLAVLTGLVSGEEAADLMRRTFADASLLLCSFPWMFTVARALEKAGVYPELNDKVLWEAYRGMLTDHLSTVPERPFICRSDCHAWSALVLHELPRKWLGVAPAAPGWQGIRIAPLPCGMEALEGTVCTPHGDVSVEIEEGGKAVFFTAPAVPVTVCLPDGREFVFPEGGTHEVR